MKTSTRTAAQTLQQWMESLLLLTALAAGLLLLLTGQLAAQTFRTLYSFTETDTNGINSDGVLPTRLVVLGGILYGSALSGGDSGTGTIFAVSTNGANFTTLYSFSALSGQGSFDINGVNSDGAHPDGLALSGSTLYGTAEVGGSAPGGTMFALNTDGSGFSTLYDRFNVSVLDGGLALPSNTLYATTVYGGDWSQGMVFAINTDGSGFTVLYSFSGGSDGADPWNLVLSGDSLFGTASAGTGPTLFRLNVDGTGFTTLHRFTEQVFGWGYREWLVVSTDAIYMVAGGPNIYALNTDGTGLRVLHTFATLQNTNGNGVSPGNLILSGNALYGTAAAGGTSGGGAVFKMNTDGTGFTTLYSFTGVHANSEGLYTNSDGYSPQVLISDGNTLYGATGYGGFSGKGTIFSISLPVNQPQLTISPAERNIVLSWPTNAIGFTLQSTTSLGPSAVWTTNSSPPVVVNNQFTVTNPIPGTQQFYRLAH